jgi:hypothetical protein
LGNVKCKFNYARLIGKRPLQNQEQLQLRPAETGRYKFKNNIKRAGGTPALQMATAQELEAI